MKIYQEYASKMPTPHASSSSILKVWVENVWAPTTHLWPFNIRDAAVEFRLIPFTFANFVPPFHAFLCSDFWLSFELMYVQATEFLNLQVLASVLRAVLMHLVSKICHRKTNIISSLCCGASIWIVQSMMVCNRSLPIAGKLLR